MRLPEPGEQLVIRKPIARKRAHIMILKTAVGMANEQYEEFARNNDWYRMNPSRKAWVRKAVEYYVEPARATLAGMLAGEYPIDLKEKIKEALILDNQFRGSIYAKRQLPKAN